MCIVTLAWQCFTKQTEDLPLVLLSNRDEFFDRPTAALHHWDTAPIVAGRDEKSGGTWLGINPQTGQWATVLNYREIGQAIPEQKISRGKLVSDYLVSDLSPRAFAQQIDLSRYDGFNLILGNRQQAFILSNRGQALESLPAGLHVFSNGQMTGQESHWAKCDRLRGRVRQEVLPLIQEQLANAHTTHPESTELVDWQRAAFDCLRDATKANIDALPDTGLPQMLEQQLSSVFIEPLVLQKHYGTRVSSVVTLSATVYQFSTQNYLDTGAVGDSVAFSV